MNRADRRFLVTIASFQDGYLMNRGFVGSAVQNTLRPAEAPALSC